MTNKNFIAGMAILSVFALIGVSLLSTDTAIASARDEVGKKFGHFGMHGMHEEHEEEYEKRSGENRQGMQKMHEDMTEALSSNDYSTWLKFVGSDSYMGKKISEENFPKFVEAHNKMEEAHKLMADLGISQMGKQGGGCGMHR